MKLANPPGAQFEILVDGKPFRARRNGGRPWQRQSDECAMKRPFFA